MEKDTVDLKDMNYFLWFFGPVGRVEYETKDYRAIALAGTVFTIFTLERRRLNCSLKGPLTINVLELTALNLFHLSRSCPRLTPMRESGQIRLL